MSILGFTHNPIKLDKILTFNENCAICLYVFFVKVYTVKRMCLAYAIKLSKMHLYLYIE